MLLSNGITILDRTVRVNEVRIIKSHSEILGFNITNETGTHLFVEPVFELGKVIRIIIRSEPK